MANATNVRNLLKLRAAPVAVAYLDEPPAGLPRWNEGQVPAGCTFWQKAQEGQSFYTVPSDHFNCAIGSYTHHIDLAPERAGELTGTLELMATSKYLEMEEVPGIPRLAKAPAHVAYAPVDDATFSADVVIVACNPAQAMLVYEAALRAGAGNALVNLIGRPACAVLPLTLNAGSAAMSLGCIGNRFNTGLPDSELYLAIPGPRWADVAARLEEIVSANETMTRYHSEQLLRIQAGQRKPV